VDNSSPILPKKTFLRNSDLLKNSPKPAPDLKKSSPRRSPIDCQTTSFPLQENLKSDSLLTHFTGEPQIVSCVTISQLTYQPPPREPSSVLGVLASTPPLTPSTANSLKGMYNLTPNSVRRLYSPCSLSLLT
jgi:hypothetical protein